MDRRKNKTQSAIFHAFAVLLSKKDYDKITIQEIIDLADIGRSTFYAHFETKDDLLEVMSEDLFRHVFIEKTAKEEHHDFSFFSSLEEQVIHIYCHIKEDALLSSILTHASGPLFWRYLAQRLTKYIEGNLSFPDETIPKDFLVYHAVNDSVSLIQWWLKNNMSEDRHVLEPYFRAIFSPGLTPKAKNTRQ